MKSPGFSKFRELLDDWDACLVEQEREKAIHDLVDSPTFVMFMKLGKEVLAGGEGSRIMFANMKKPDEDFPKEDASCTMFNLTGIVTGSSGQRIVSQNDIKKAKIIDRDKACEILGTQATKDFKGDMNIVVQVEGD